MGLIRGMAILAFLAEIEGGGRLDCGPEIDPCCLGLPLGALANVIFEPMAPIWLCWPLCVGFCCLIPFYLISRV